MAGGWTRDGAVQDQIDDTVKDAILRAGTKLSRVSPDRPTNQEQPRKGAQPAGPALPNIPTGWLPLALSWGGQQIAGIAGEPGEPAPWPGVQVLRLATLGSGRATPPGRRWRQGGAPIRRRRSNNP